MNRTIDKGNASYSLRIALLALLLVFALELTGCGGSGGDGGEAAVDMGTLQEQMLTAYQDAGDSPAAMDTVTEESDSPEALLATVTDIELKDVEHFFISYSTEGTADEIVVLCMKDSNKAKDAEESLSAHKDSRAALFRTYGPEEAARIEESGLVFSKDRYAVLIICDGSDSVKAAFEKALADASAE
ncbi:MAG: DUF4358 domain-containing protein [Firmicutes bacterium]|nr:DUF4358 domain-containing protein [Bacillota bacterium]